MAISGNDLTIEQVASFVDRADRQVYLTTDSLGEVGRAHEYLLRLASREVIYGLNTGFGPLASVILGPSQLVDLQYNLIRSHAAGIGTPLERRFVLAAMLIRLNTLARGCSGVSPELLHLLEVLVNHRVCPIVPEHGAVGASGDLVQLAHIALALIGEGEVFVDDVRMSAGEALQRFNLRPHALRPKEGLALINGTAVMTGIAALACRDAERLVEQAIRHGALCLELVAAFDDGISPELQAVRPHPGQRDVARRLRKHLEGSRRLRQRRVTLTKHGGKSDLHQIDAPVQEVYSIRCIPQIVGPVCDTLAAVRERVATELNAVTDNPIVLWREERVVHGGNFHGDYISLGMDQLKIALTKLTMLTERRINYLVNPNISHPWPAFANRRTPGLTLGLQGLQFVATSTTAQSQTLAYPQYLHSISTNGDNQDVVSLGTDAALLTTRTIRNAFVVLGIEAVVLAQIVDCLGIEEELCAASRALYREVREIVPVVDDDRAIGADVERLVEWLHASERTLEEEVPPAGAESAIPG
jgi:histidine ammonia-lyase